jgi:hypothetical protein
MLLRSVRLVLCGLPAIRREPRSPARLRPGFALQASGFPSKFGPVALTLGGGFLIRRAATFCFSIIMREVVV